MTGGSMNTESMHALRRANPRSQPGFAASVEASADAVRARIAALSPQAAPRRRRPLPRLVLAGASIAAVAVAIASFTIGSSGVGTATAAAVEKAATVTAASAERSGTAVVRITHAGELWAGSTVRWHGSDLSVAGDAAESAGRRPGTHLLVVGGMMYGVDENGGWVELGRPESIDPGSGTTPDEYLAAVREDVGGTTLRRIASGVTGLTARQLDDGSTVYRGQVAAGSVARKTGFKGGEALRVLPFGYVAHGAAGDPAALLSATLVVGADGAVREISVAWETWRYTVTYRGLGTGAPLEAPENARPLLRDRIG
jgi:hypothetical protein